MTIRNIYRLFSKIGKGTRLRAVSCLSRMVFGYLEVSDAGDVIMIMCVCDECHYKGHM